MAHPDLYLDVCCSRRIACSADDTTDATDTTGANDTTDTTFRACSAGELGADAKAEAEASSQAHVPAGAQARDPGQCALQELWLWPQMPPCFLRFIERVFLGFNAPAGP